MDGSSNLLLGGENHRPPPLPRKPIAATRHVPPRWPTQCLSAIRPRFGIAGCYSGSPPIWHLSTSPADHHGGRRPQMNAPPVLTRPTGLTADDVAVRVARGETNASGERTSRSFAEILRANIFTRFNFILGTLLVAILAVGDVQDALFGIVLVSNALIGIVQEVRAKRTLDNLAVLNAPRARVVRDGSTSDIDVDEVVLDDIVELHTGDQVV